MKKILATILAAALAGGIGQAAWGAAGATLTPSGTNIAIDDFISAVAAVTSGGTYNGNGVTVDLSGTTTTRQNYPNSDGRQVYLFGDQVTAPESVRSTPVTIKNVNFIFGDSFADSSMGQIYVYSSANITFENCVFDNVGVSFDGVKTVQASNLETVTSKFVNCTFKNLNNYAIKYVYNTEITGCEFSNVKRAIMVSPNTGDAPAASSVKITDNTFTSQTSQDRVIKFYQVVTDSDTRVEITGNDVSSDGCLGANGKFIQVDFSSGQPYNTYDYGTTVFTISDNTNITSENLNEATNENTKWLELAASTVPPVKFAVRSDNLFGSIKVDGNVASNLYVAVPFEGFEADGALRKAQDVVHAANLTAGTKMYVYDKNADKYDVFEVDANGKWAAALKINVTEMTNTFDTADLMRGVTNGTGVIVGRKNTAETVYVYGQVPKIPIASTTFGAGQTLVSPPYTNGVAYVDLNASTWTGVKATQLKRLKNQKGADYIQFRTADNRLVKYFYLEGEGWGVVPTQVSLFSQFVANGKALIPVGTAFWYYSTSGGAKVEWK